MTHQSFKALRRSRAEAAGTFMSFVPMLLGALLVYGVIFTAGAHALLSRIEAPLEAQFHARFVGGGLLAAGVVAYLWWLNRSYLTFVLELEGETLTVGGVSGWRTVRRTLDVALIETVQMDDPNPLLRAAITPKARAVAQFLRSGTLLLGLRGERPLRINFAANVFEPDSFDDTLEELARLLRAKAKKQKKKRPAPT